MSGREKNLVMLAAGAIGLFVIYQFALTPLFGYYDRLGREIPTMREDLLTARRVKKRYGTLDKEIKAIQERLDQRAKEFNAHDFLGSTLANREGVQANVDDINVNVKEPSEGYQEEVDTVKLRTVALNKLVNYLYAIEHSGQLITVRELTIRSDAGDSLLLDVTFDACTFRKAGARDEKQEAAPVPKKPRPRKRQ
jgi:hypothetical protein